VTLYCIHPNYYLVDARAGEAICQAITTAPLRFRTLFASCTEQLQQYCNFFTHQDLPVNPTTPPMTWFLSNLRSHFRMRLCAMPKSRMRLVWLLCKLSISEISRLQRTLDMPGFRESSQNWRSPVTTHFHKPMYQSLHQIDCFGKAKNVPDILCPSHSITTPETEFSLKFCAN
jgi:hypothetical protein